MKIVFARDYQDMSRKAANIVSAQVLLKNDCVLGLATGGTPVGLYRQLIEWQKKDDISFRDVRSVNLDEYVGLPPEHAQSYRYYMNKTFFDQIDIDKANKRPLGSVETCNKRVINQYIHPAVMQSCQLCMGMTQLAPGSNWNSMPCHTHERRMEVYFYFDLKDNNVVFHMMGEPTETRHLLMHNEQAVISPSWSIHTGVGTSNYTFIWGMCGENQEFDDMDNIDPIDLR